VAVEQLALMSRLLGLVEDYHFKSSARCRTQESWVQRSIRLRIQQYSISAKINTSTF